MRRSVRSVVVLSLVAASVAFVPRAGAGRPDTGHSAADDSTVGQPAPSEWRQFGRIVTHPDNAPAETAFDPANVTRLAPAWSGRFGTFASGEGGAAVVNGLAYIGGSDATMSVFSVSRCASGDCRPVWTAVTDNGIFGTPAVSHGLVLVGSADRHVYAFHARGCGHAICRPVWRGQLQDAALASVAVSGTTAYIGDFGGHIYAFPISGCGRASCPPRWTGFGGPNLELNTTPAVAGGHVFIGALLNTPEDASGRLFSFKAGGCGDPTCQPEWSADLLGQSDGTLSPLVSGATLFMGSGTRFSDVPNGHLHLFAFDVAGCGTTVCRPKRSYDTGDSDLTGGLALSHGVLYAGSQSTPDPNTEGVFTAFRAAGCGAAVCEPLWTAVNFASGAESPPVVTGGVVFVAKGPASGFPVDEAVLGYRAGGCGAQVCRPISFTQLGTQQFYLGAPIAIADHALLVPTEASVDGADTLVALQVPAAS